MAADDSFRPGRRHFTPGGGLSGVRVRTGVLKGLVIIPRHPRCRILGHLGAVFLQLGEVIEGIGVVQFAGVNQAHKQVPHPSALLGLIE